MMSRMISAYRSNEHRVMVGTLMVWGFFSTVQAAGAPLLQCLQDQIKVRHLR